jgi:uncharacterized protein
MTADSPASVSALPAELVPVAPQERVLLLDVLRGMCLLGVLWSNLNDWYMANDPVTPLDHTLRWTQDWLLESRFYSMLGFLFGIGFAIQLTRAAQRGQGVATLFLRRMSILLVFGVVHGMLIWQGDILHAYALLGFALVLFGRFSTRKLLIAALTVWLALPFLFTRIVGVFHWTWPSFSFEHAIWIYSHGTWRQIVTQGAKQFLFMTWRWSLFTYPSFLALFILGLWAWRVDLIGRLTRRRASILSSLLGALICWAAAQYLTLKIRPARSSIFVFLDDATTWANSAVYALTFALLMSFPAVAKRLQPLAALGRMTLTTYLVQSLVCTTLFYHWGFGLMVKTNYTGMLLVTVFLFSLQIVFSIWWLKRFRFGPMEWLWRSLAYGKKLPNRFSPPSSLAF